MSGWVKTCKNRSFFFAFDAGFDQMFDPSSCYGVPVHCWRQGRHLTTSLLKTDMHYLHYVTVSLFSCKHVYRMQQRF